MIKKILLTIKKSIRDFFYVFSMKALNSLPNNGIVGIIDVGAAGEIEPRWKQFTKKLNYHGFEPDKRSREIIKNNEKNFNTYKIYSQALGNFEGNKILNLCRTPEVSSVFRPNRKILNNFPKSERFDILNKINLPVVTLDSLNFKNIDFIKLDIQGAELEALEGSKKLLDDILGIEIEVEFHELYTNQPLFGDICNYLSKFDIEFIDFLNVARWERDAHSSYGQAVFGDGLFLKTPECLNYNKINIDKLSAYLAILLIYRRFDIIERTLKLIPPDKSNHFISFRRSLNNAKIVDSLLKRIVGIFSRFVGLFGAGYRLHLIN